MRIYEIVLDGLTADLSDSVGQLPRRRRRSTVLAFPRRIQRHSHGS